MKDSGFVKLNRSILEWEWFQDSNAVHVLVYLLAAVNRLPGRWQGIDIAPGSIVTSRAKISAATGMSEKQVRLALDKLEQCGTITRDGAGKGQLVTLVKWAEYQIDTQREGRETGRERAGRGPDEGRERATILEGEKLRREEGEKSKSPDGDLADRRDPEVQVVVEFFEAQLGARLDGTVKANRQAAYSLIRKMRKDFPDHDAVVSVKALIQAAREDEFHRKNATGFEYLLRNTMKIIEAKKQRANNPKHQTDHEYRHQVAAELARRQAERAAHQA